MPSLKSALRVLLILCLLANGISAAWASTGMALKAVEHLNATGLDAAAKDAAAAADCEPGTQGKQDPERGGIHQDCDCASQCGCLLTFYSASPGFRFAGTHLLDSHLVPRALVQPVLTPISAVFRPPIS